MPIYQPPKKSGVGSIFNTAGDISTGAGAIVSATGIGAPIGAAIAGMGAIYKGIGSLIDGNSEKKAEEYENAYKAQILGEQNQQQSASNVLQQSSFNYTQQGVSSSVKAINEMMSPTTSTGIVNNRLI